MHLRKNEKKYLIANLPQNISHLIFIKVVEISRTTVKFSNICSYLASSTPSGSREPIWLTTGNESDLENDATVDMILKNT